MSAAPPPELYTEWGEQLDRDHPLPEYPRPQLVRDSYQNLNGVWWHAFAGKGQRVTVTGGDPIEVFCDGDPLGPQPIVVPFSPEAPLSGVGRQLQPDEILHYWRSFELPPGFAADGDRVLLHFGGVDQSCVVRVNGRVVGSHSGGYLPFHCDITDALRLADNLLHVEVTDPSDTGAGSRGKQRLKRGGIWYTAQSGIWQTVWLEAVPATSIARLEIVPELAPAGGGVDAVTVTVRLDGPAVDEIHVEVLASDRLLASVPAERDTPTRIAVPDARRWTPEDPHLYDLTVTAGSDRVTSYFGMRTFGVGPDETGLPRLLLNGEPYFHAGVLDQGYWPDGLYTPPSDEAMVFDIATMKRLGFTMLRKHIKIEPLRWYHHCDRLGMLVWQDLVNGGTSYHYPVISAPAVTPWRLRDTRYRAFSRQDAAARVAWLQELRATIELLRNTACIAVWVPFNEGWGQFRAAAVAAQVRELDPTRVIDHASGWHDQGAGDLTSLHVYFRRFRVPRRRAATAQRALVLSEFGGYSLRLAEHAVSEREFGYRKYDTGQELADAYRRLHEDQIIPAVADGLAATVYTQLSDVEDETNGLLTYDRKVLKIDEELVRELNGQLGY